MKQYNQIGKRPLKDEILSAKSGKTFVTPNGFEYTFDYRKEGKRYIFIIGYRGAKMQILESDFNRTPIEDIINCMRQEILTD